MKPEYGSRSTPIQIRATSEGFQTASYQYQNLPKLMKLFPSIQFIVTTHSPFFVLGMEEVFGSDGFCVYEFPLGCQISAEYFGEFEDAFQSMKRTDRFKKEIKDAQEPIVILEAV